MSEIGLEHLAALTDVINARLKEFGLHNMPQLSAGHIRIAHDEIKRFYQEREEAWAMQRISEVTITSVPSGLPAMRLSDQGYKEGYEAAARDLARGTSKTFTEAETAQEFYRGYENGYEAAKNEMSPERAEPEPDSIDFSSLPASPLRESTLSLRAKHENPATGIADDDWCGPDADWDGPQLTQEEEKRLHDEAIEAIIGIDTMAEFLSNGFSSLPAVEDSQSTESLRAKHENTPKDAAGMPSPQIATVRPEPVAPLIPRRPGRSRTIAEADELEAELSAIIVALQAMAVDGAMPPILTWESDRPVTLPRWEMIQRHHDIASWAQMAGMADLEYGQYRERISERKLEERVKPGPKPGADVSGREQPTLAQLVAHLQKIAMAGVMPTQTVFDDTRPAGWSRATSLCTKLEISWEDLAREAELKPNPRGQRVVATPT